MHWRPCHLFCLPLRLTISLTVRVNIVEETRGPEALVYIESTGFFVTGGSKPGLANGTSFEKRHLPRTQMSLGRQFGFPSH
jgi:hypothetical protein